MKGHVVTLQILFLYVFLEFLDSGKWKKHFPDLFSGNMAQLMNLWGYWYFLSNKGGRVSCHPRYGKAEVVTLGNLYVNKHATLKSPFLLQFPNCKLCDNDN